MGSSGAEAAANTTALNCISLSDPDIHNSVSLLKQACVDSGFFYVIDHGISQEFMDEVFAQSKRFFDLPLNEKMKLLRNEKHRGYTPILDQILDRDNQADGDYKEGYYIGVEVPEDDPKAEKPFFGPNVWPSTDILPGWRKIMEQYHSEVLGVAKKVARIIGLALGLDANFFDQPEMLGDPIANLRLLHYEGKASNPLKGIYGAGAHTDFGFITLLATDDVVGLQICKDRDAQPQVWEYVSPLKGKEPTWRNRSRPFLSTHMRQDCMHRPACQVVSFGTFKPSPHSFKTSATISIRISCCTRTDEGRANTLVFCYCWQVKCIGSLHGSRVAYMMPEDI